MKSNFQKNKWIKNLNLKAFLKQLNITIQKMIFKQFKFKTKKKQSSMNRLMFLGVNLEVKKEKQKTSNSQFRKNYWRRFKKMNL